MSGGHWEYNGFAVRDALETWSSDVEVQTRWPKLARCLGLLGPALGEVEHDMDWDLSGDSCIEDDTAFDETAVKRLREAVA